MNGRALQCATRNIRNTMNVAFAEQIGLALNSIDVTIKSVVSHTQLGKFVDCQKGSYQVFQLWRTNRWNDFLSIFLDKL